jgi:peroxiredoxin
MFLLPACSDDNPTGTGNGPTGPALFPADGAVLTSDFSVSVGTDAIDTMVVFLDETMVAVVSAPPFTLPMVMVEYGPGEHSLAVVVIDGDDQEILAADILMCYGTGLDVGNFAPTFALEDLDGKMQSFRAAPDARVLLLDFWATWCPPCVRALPETQRLFDEYGEDGLKVLTITSESQEIVRPFMREHDYSFPVLLDTEAFARMVFDVYAIPKYFVIDRSGVVRHVYVGGGGPSLEDIIQDLLSGNIPPSLP